MGARDASEGEDAQGDQDDDPNEEGDEGGLTEVTGSWVVGLRLLVAGDGDGDLAGGASLFDQPDGLCGLGE